MPRLRWYKAEPRAFFDATRGWPNELKANYRLVLDLIYAHDGALPDDDRWIAGELGLAARVWRRLKDRLLELGKLYLDGGAIRNPRADRDVPIALDRLNKTVFAGEKSGEKRRNEKAKPGNFNGSGGTPVGTPARTIEIKKEDREDTSSSGVPPSRTRAHEAAAAIPEASRLPLEVDFLERVEAGGGDPFAAAQVLGAWKAEFAAEGYAATLRATLATARRNVLALAELKFGDLRRNRHRGEAEARQQQTSEWSADALIAAAARRQMAERDAADAWPTVTECPRLGGPE